MQRIQLTKGKISHHIIELLKPMIAGSYSLVLFGLADTYFVGWLGTEAQAAISFAFPVILTINSIIVGIGLGAATSIATQIGKRNINQANALATVSLALILLVTSIISMIGISSTNIVFKWLGADEAVLKLIRQYMIVWYCGLPLIAIPMIGNNIMRAMGNVAMPSLMMVIAAIINMLLDPLLILGVGPLPRLEIQGAATATVISRTVTALITLYILKCKDKIIKWRYLKKILSISFSIARVAIPNILSHIIVPVGAGVITGIIAKYGMDAVAGFGVASRIEQLVLVPLNSLAAIMIPFIAQNNGAEKYKRIQKSVKLSTIGSISYGGVAIVLLLLFSPQIAKWFNDKPLVIQTTTAYLRIVCFAYGFQGVFLLAVAGLNALKAPLLSGALSVIQFFAMYLPLAILLQRILEIKGVFLGLTLSHVGAATIGFFILQYKLKQKYIKNWIPKDKHHWLS